MEDQSTTSGSSPTRARGRGKSRGGLGKYLRARGRGRGRGRPAEWGQRLVLDGEQAELNEEEQRELEQKFARRQLSTNADRYAEPEPELDSEGEELKEPDIDLSSFLERQRLSAQPSALLSPDEDEDVDHSLAHVVPATQTTVPSKKGKVQQVEWDASLEEMRREKAAAEAKWDLKTRFRAQAATQRGKPTSRGGSASRSSKQQDKVYSEAPLLPTEQKPEKPEREDMQDFLDDLLG
ncbi:predicted protein [Postia placenta Mad-698-R]|uniref:Uncharacterized protein n=1 Tax=Postia placenta MAD-698-R-SB12 TaxID=670580 RepID=A0A1X6MJX2_9APHY|nr:hypothetical protein POSPLADRAFT_1062504 [Postia placenta MAD-698-R-SB12]EED83644.1 predicted protein [Postia placenta Mad-698-R]OSX56684.1 hypothetical protein POSPLADRAFT_1062504 [Postia placenta MAD-698-R-SB12]